MDTYFQFKLGTTEKAFLMGNRLFHQIFRRFEFLLLIFIKFVMTDGLWQKQMI
jgi:hypothetical protein